MRVTFGPDSPVLSAHLRRPTLMLCTVAALAATMHPFPARADSINSPNITMNVDANRSTGPGAGGDAVTVNTITVAETMVNEYSAGAGKAIVFKVRPGYQFDPASNVTAQSAAIGFNGAAVNAAAIITPSGVADEVITFTLTSGTGGSQDIIRVNGIRLRILSAAGAAGPAQTTLSVTTATAGGAFTDQGIVATTITAGAADHLVFAAQPASAPTGGELLPAVKIVDFGGNLVSNDQRLITLAIQDNPGATTLLGINGLETDAGVATWIESDNLRIETAAIGYTLRAFHAGPNFLSSDTVDSGTFDVSGGAPDHLEFSLSPADTGAGGDILLSVTVKDVANNTLTSPPVQVTLDSAVNPGGWPLLVDTSLTKTTVAGVATWGAADHLRINKAITGYRLLASGAGAPVQSEEFNIAAAIRSSLRFLVQPTGTQVGASIVPPIVVEILDAFGNRTSSAETVNLALSSSCGGTLSGGTTTGSGLAIFDAVRIDTACAGVRLEAALGNLPRTNSDPFSVSDVPPVAVRFAQQPTTVGRGAAFNPPVTVEIIDGAGERTASTATVELTLLSSCGGALSATSAGAVGGLATFAVLSVDTACTAVTLQATAAGLIGTTSNAFDVTSLPPAALRFVQQPATVGQGVAFNPPVTVEIVDAGGIRTDSTATVQLALQSSCGGTLSTASADAVGGLATFAALSIDTPCPAATLQATAAGLTGTTSNAFEVTALPPVALRFVRQPTRVAEDVAFSPPVTVEIVDAAGERTANTATVDLALLSSCGGALSATSAGAVGGLATFAVLSVDTPCTAVTLQATAAGLTGTTSNAFEVTRRRNTRVGFCGQGVAAVIMPILLVLVALNIRSAGRRSQ